ncbi:MAG: acetamidase/formamidase family protein [Tissierellia bacterium]|nr:acetamidase/formamidase family protein [Tissierellia bacterium]
MKVIDGSKVIHSFKSDMEPVEKVNPKEIFKVCTNDCFHGQLIREDQTFGELDYSLFNPATGPIYIEGAEAGDLLKVKILDIQVPSKGVSVTVPKEGVLGNKVTKALTKIIEIKDGSCNYNGIQIPIRPMIGVIGVAPKEGEYDTATPWKHGGNMDTADIGIGSTLYFPVNQKGALLALGDCHALMADGEIACSGLEIAAEVILQVDVIKGKEIAWPLVETDDYTMVIASGDTLDEAVYAASDEAVKYLAKGLNMSWEEAYILASLAVDIRISQLVDPKLTVRAVIPKRILETQKIIRSL